MGSLMSQMDDIGHPHESSCTSFDLRGTLNAVKMATNPAENRSRDFGCTGSM